MAEFGRTQGTVNLLRNGSFEQWAGGVPTDWTLAGAGATVTKDATTFYLGLASAKLTRSGANATLVQSVHGKTIALSYVQGRTFTLSVYVQKGTGVKAQVGLDDGIGQSWSGFACQVGGWPVLTVTRTVENSATKLEAVLRVETDGDAWFDGAILVEGAETPAFVPNPADMQDGANSAQAVPATPTGLTTTTKMLAVRVYWDANPETDIEYYDLQRADDSGFTTNVLTRQIYATELRDNTGNANTYHYRLRAVRYSRATSAWTSGVSGAGAQIVNSEIETGAVSAGAWNADETEHNSFTSGEFEILHLTLPSSAASGFTAILAQFSAANVDGSSITLRIRKGSGTSGTILRSRVIPAGGGYSDGGGSAGEGGTSSGGEGSGGEGGEGGGV